MASLASFSPSFPSFAPIILCYQELAGVFLLRFASLKGKAQEKKNVEITQMNLNLN